MITSLKTSIEYGAKYKVLNCNLICHLLRNESRYSLPIFSQCVLDAYEGALNCLL